MKKLLITLCCLVLAAALGFGVFAAVQYHMASADDVPALTVTAFGHSLPPAQGTWQVPVAGGLWHRSFTVQAAPPAALPLTLGQATLGLQAPGGYTTTVQLLYADGATTAAMAPEAWREELLTEAATQLTVECVRPQGQRGLGHGRFTFVFPLNVRPAPPPPPEPPKLPTLLQGATTLQQGDIFTMQALHLPEGVVPTAESDLGLAIFTPMEEAGCWFAAVPVGNTATVGQHTVRVTAGEEQWDVTLAVEAFPFIEQNLEIDLTTPEITEANSAEAYAQYNATIPPLFSVADEERHWNGVFIWPCRGRISTEFGLIRYTNGDYSRGRAHPAIDIAVGTGTPVVAPGAGRVLFADYLLNTGWTIVIEHGGGLKSLYYHMNDIAVAAGDMVPQGHHLGTVGSTGYSTGPHLHFEMRIGNQAISPTMLFEETAGLYATFAEAGAGEEDAAA